MFDFNAHQFRFHSTGKSGVDFDEETTVMSSEEASSGVAAITVDTKSGDNMIIVTPGTNFLLSPSDVRDSLQTLAKKHSIAHCFRRQKIYDVSFSGYE